MPQVFDCVHCGKQDMLKQERVWFLAGEGGLYCDTCRAEKTALSAGQDEVLVGTSTIYTMQYIVSTPLNKLFTFTVSEEVLREFGDVMKRFLEKQVGRTMKSEQMLEILG